MHKLRQEFKFWYPMDCRVSGKARDARAAPTRRRLASLATTLLIWQDLIPNHLTMCLYNHAAIWDDAAMWPRSVFCNGFVQVRCCCCDFTRGALRGVCAREAVIAAAAAALTSALVDAGRRRENLGEYLGEYAQVDAEKMSKSKGNFITLIGAIETWGADATRVACADAGDTVQSANYDRVVADRTCAHDAMVMW